MKKLKIMFVAGLATLALCFGFFLPVGYVSADEVSQTPEISAEIGVETPAESESVENTGDYTASYYAQTSETDGVRLDFIDETNVKCVMFVEGVEVGTLNATYQRVDNIVDIYVFDEWFGAFKLNGDGTATDVSWWEEYNKETPDENPPVLDEETQDGTPIIDKDMDKFLQPILCGAAGLVGTLIVVAIVLFFLKKYGKEVKEFLKWLRERKVSFENEEKTLKTIDGHILSTYNKLEELREKNGTEYAEVLKLVKDLISTVLKENADTHHITDEHYHKIMKILEMLAVGNSELVRKGVADNIVKEIETADKV